MSRRRLIARELAAALLSGSWSASPLEARAQNYLGKSGKRWQRKLVADVLGAASPGYPPSPDILTQRLLKSRSFERAAAVVLRQENPPPLVLDPSAFAPAPAFAAMRPPRLETPGDVAVWLQMPLTRLEWLADQRRQHGRTNIPILLHYHYRFTPKRSGGAPRLIEAPKAQLKAVQRRILSEILDLAPAHPQAHGFVRGRSCLTAAHLHAGEHIVVCADLKNFFPSISAARIHGLFRSFGYPTAVARLLTGLSTTCTPTSVFARLPAAQQPDWRTRKQFGAPHLAQGAPTSPALANLCAWRLDQRLNGLARALGGRYTRYADDLSFSGDATLTWKIDALLAALGKIAKEEGFALNSAKTRIMRRSGPQRITGIVVNEHANVARADYDQLKAILHNCRTGGPETQNRAAHADFRAHLDGRVGWVEQVNPTRGAKLRAICDSVEWG